LQAIRWLFKTFIAILWFFFEVIKLILMLIAAFDNLLLIGGLLAALGGICAICSIPAL
jgi:hypothetical protein